MISKNIKRRVIQTVIETGDFLGEYYEADSIIIFLDNILDLKSLRSKDPRFKNAYGDAYQHLVNNDDWSLEYVFFERFDFINSEDSVFIKFVEAVVSPELRGNKESILNFVILINPLFKSSNYKLILSDYFEELPVYKLRETKIYRDLPIDIIANKIPVFIDYSDSKEIKYPNFFLKKDNWDDFGHRTTFSLKYNLSAFQEIYIGEVKIMKKECLDTFDVLDKRFTSLDNDFCSLGQSKSYYRNLKKQLGNNFSSFLLAIRDAAIFPRINEEFEEDSIYKKSLIRFDDPERLVRSIRFELEGINPNEYFKFKFKHRPPYSENEVTLKFNFDYGTGYDKRVYGLIGKNGTGKTKILSSLAVELSNKNSTAFFPRRPIYGKVFTVSYSVFDSFEIPEGDVSFNYVYCGLKKNSNEWKKEEDLIIDFIQSIKRLSSKNLEGIWYETIIKFVDDDLLELMVEVEETFIKNYSFKEINSRKFFKYLSSGQSIIVYILTEILSQIRYDSLILFDEPETHLHPNAITELLSIIFDLVNKFESFCVIATHSPLIIQEIHAENIFIIEREGNLSSIRKLEQESFGQDLTVITNEIFGNREIRKHFVWTIKNLISKGNSYDQIIEILGSEDLPVNSNIKLYLKALMRDEQ